MKWSTVTSKGQATIPAGIRKHLGLHVGDRVIFEVVKDAVVIRRMQAFDYEYHQALAKTLSEWDSKEDDEAYGDL